MAIVAYACDVLDRASLEQFVLSNVIDCKDSFEIGDDEPKLALQVRALC